MNEENMTKARLLQEMQKLRQRISELERKLDEPCGPIPAAAQRPPAPSNPDSAKRQTQIEDDLNCSRKMLESALANMSDAVFISDADGNIVEFNEAFATYHRFKSKEECSRRISECFSRFDAFFADGTPASSELWAVPRALRGERGENVEYTLRLRSTGETWTGRYNFSPIRSQDGQIIGSVVIVHEITRDKQVAEFLRESEQRLAFHTDNSPLGIIEWDTNFVVTRWSGEAERIFGWNAAEILGRKLLDLNMIFEDDIPHVHRVSERLTSGLSRHVFSCNRNYTKDRKIIICEWYNSVLLDDHGKMISVLSQILDITDRKHTEDALRQATEDVRELAKNLRELAADSIRTEQRERQRIATLLHDHVQQLLVSAQMQVGLLRRTGHHQNGATLAILESTLKEALTATTTLTIDLFPPVLSKPDMIAAFSWLARYMEEKHCFKMHLVSQTKCEPATFEERTFLFESVRELMLNVLKHAGVREARLVIPVEPDNRFTVVVEDDGRGFAPDSIKPGTRKGFGLFSIGERLLHLGGTILIDSAPGHGAKITLSIPLKTAEAANGVQSPAVEMKFDPIRVLLADDHKMVRQGLTSLLQAEADIEVVGEAENGIEAIEKAHLLQPDVVILDVNMPEMDGIQAVSRISKEMPAVKVIALSVYNEQHAADVMRSAGAYEYIPKGSPLEHLIATIRACQRNGI
ncbi:PAS domain S-box protein [Candidatus Ozemobacteraceae bacterium]|nr:PAS domain S-box protein [Candidatus Ozemobacteraceae bacterium]